MKTQVRKKKPASDQGSIIDVNQQDLSIVASAPFEEAQNWEAMSVDDLWRLHEKIVMVITTKIHSEKQMLEARLRQLGRSVVSPKSATAKKPAKSKRRPYPRVLPKYRDRTNPSVTWSGRGKQPRWLSAQLSLGKKLADFRID